MQVLNLLPFSVKTHISPVGEIGQFGEILWMVNNFYAVSVYLLHARPSSWEEPRVTAKLLQF
jgi:hypothetical protein